MSTSNETELRKIVASSKKESELFYKKHIEPTSDLITLVVKMHLFLEKIVNDIISNLYNHPRKIVDKRFSEKIDLLEAEGFIPIHIVTKIRALNSIRNKLVHNLDYQLNQGDLNILVKEIDLGKQTNPTIQLKISMHFLIGFLQAVRDIGAEFPFLMSCVRKNERYMRDVTYNFKDIFGSRLSSIKDSLNNLKRSLK